ncbi:MAG: alpha/beta hydrolase [Desulforhopalus sp.]|nr:alpha/beta hydrolase [Desulforhopalus sp.]
MSPDIRDERSQWLWPEYYQAFPAFSEKTVRKGCHPRKMVHPGGADQAVVLVHGLSDSPYFMAAIGEYFHATLGYDVYIPLLQCHGLKCPERMVGVSLTEWQKNVRFAIVSATATARRVSIGGLSTGGALGYLFACMEPAINGDLYLFSAALGLSAWPFGIPGRFKEWLLRRQWIGRLDTSRPMVGNHPYRYDRISLNSAAELAVLIGQIKAMPCRFADSDKPDRRIFAAWSECDTVVSLDKIRNLQKQIPAGRFRSFIISAADRVDHACVVLREPIYGLLDPPGSPPLEKANPRFAEMLAAVDRFARGN